MITVLRITDRPLKMYFHKGCPSTCYMFYEYFVMPSLIFHINLRIIFKLFSKPRGIISLQSMNSVIFSKNCCRRA